MTHKFYLPVIFLFLSTVSGVVAQMVYKGSSVISTSIPVVGNILVPVIGVDLAPLIISYFYFSVGFFFWIILFPVFFSRAVFQLHELQVLHILNSNEELGKKVISLRKGNLMVSPPIVELTFARISELIT